MVWSRWIPQSERPFFLATSASIVADSALRLFRKKLVTVSEASLTEVNLDGYPLPIKQLKGSETVESINLSGQYLGVASAVVIASLIQGNASLTECNLRNNSLGEKGATILCDALRESKVTSMQELNLSDNGIGPAGAKAVAAMAAVVASPTSLNLAQNNLGGETGYVKAAKVKGASFNVGDKVIYGGREMIVSKGKDSDGDIQMRPVDWLLGINAIADALRFSGSLTRLDVKYNSLGKEGSAMLRRAVEGRSGFELKL